MWPKMCQKWCEKKIRPLTPKYSPICDPIYKKIISKKNAKKFTRYKELAYGGFILMAPHTLRGFKATFSPSQYKQRK